MLNIKQLFKMKILKVQLPHSCLTSKQLIQIITLKVNRRDISPMHKIELNYIKISIYPSIEPWCIPMLMGSCNELNPSIDT